MTIFNIAAKVLRRMANDTVSGTSSVITGSSTNIIYEDGQDTFTFDSSNKVSHWSWIAVDGESRGVSLPPKPQQK
jgi:hypothetical protein